MKVLSAFAIAIVMAAPVFATAAEPAGAKNIVIVHGSFVDGSGWRVVHDILWLKGYNVSVVHQPQTTLDANVAAARKIVDQQTGAVVLVGHSSGGSVVTIAGSRPKVKALVYVAALVPEVGESISQLHASMPPLSNSIETNFDGQMYFKRDKFREDFAADLLPNRTNFMSISQAPTNFAITGARTWEAAWHDKPSYAIVACDDRALSPDLQRSMYKRAGAKVTELKASHLVYISQPEEVAKVIETAALSVK
jgi:pimeloyl-ACP methyl ester carboxylesterase